MSSRSPGLTGGGADCRAGDRTEAGGEVGRRAAGSSSVLIRGERAGSLSWAPARSGRHRCHRGCGTCDGDARADCEAAAAGCGLGHGACSSSSSTRAPEKERRHRRPARRTRPRFSVAYSNAGPPPPVRSLPHPSTLHEHVRPSRRNPGRREFHYRAGPAGRRTQSQPPSRCSSHDHTQRRSPSLVWYTLAHRTSPGHRPGRPWPRST